MAVLTATSLSKSCDVSLEFQRKRGWKARYESNELDEGERLMDLRKVSSLMLSSRLTIQH